MKRMFRKSGFTLVELLTVIAIIAILAAIIFPVMSSVKGRARQTQCMSNLKQVGMGLQLFKTDNRRYPVALVTCFDTAVPFDQAKSDAGLLGEYVKGGASVFSCPSSSFSDKLVTVDQTIGANPVKVYQYNSYEGFNGGGTFEQHYCYDWWKTPDLSTMDTNCPPPPGGNTVEQDYMRQLKFRNPPDDTVVTWCSYHENRSGGAFKGKAIVLFLGGNCILVDAAKIETYRWRMKEP